MASNINEIVADLFPIIRIYRDGTIERLESSFAPPSSEHQSNDGVLSKDLKISEEVSARLYLPDTKDSNQEKLPILVYYHGGGFCIGSPFSPLQHQLMNLLASEAKALVISVEYRLAPEHPLPAAYDDCWNALQWVASHVVDSSDSNKESWLINHGNFDKLYVGGDSSGGNITHNITMRTGAERLNGDVKILGAFLTHPYFMGSDCDSNRGEYDLLCGLWMLAYPAAPSGIDHPMINPLANDAPSLSGLGCSKLLVTVAEKDFLKQKAILYVEAVKRSEWKGEVELIEIKGEDHSFHTFRPDSKNGKILIKHLVSFLGS